jgi:hypothetical protein
MWRRSPEPQHDFDDLSGELDDEDEAPTLEMGRNIDPDFDALFPDDDPPTQVRRPNWPRMPAGRRILPSSALPALQPPPMPASMAALEMTGPAMGAYYSAPRPPPASYQPQPGNSQSIAPVMLAPAEPAAPARSWPVFLGAALVGCAAVAVATVPLLLKGFAFQESTTTYVVAAPAPPPPAARKVAQRRAAEESRVPGDVMRIEDLPIAVATIDELPVMPEEAASPAPKAHAAAPSKVAPSKVAPSKAAPSKAAPSKAAPSTAAPGKAQLPATAAKPAQKAPAASSERAASTPARDSGAKSMLKAALDASNAASAPAAAEQPAAGETDATLHVIANPPANVAVDGRPLGMTPQTITLAPGAHVIVFAGAESREVRQIDLSAGGEKTVSVSF